MDLKNPENIHVLHVLNSAHGGSAISTLELIAQLKDRGIYSSLICFNNANTSRQQFISSLLDGRVLFIPLYWTNKRIRVSLWKRPVLEAMNIMKTWRGYRFQKQIDKFIEDHGINLVHTSTILNPEGAIAAKRNKIPHVWHVRELIGPDKYFQFYNYARWKNFVMDRCYRLIANSRITQQCLEKYFPVEKIVYIPNGIDIAAFAVKKHKTSGRSIVAMVGSVTSRVKNHALFINVAALFSSRPDIEFRIYGALPEEGDEYYNSLRAMIAKTENKIVVRFMDFTQKPSAIMQEVDVLFHPAPLESFGRIYAEAFAAGIPVVAPDGGGALEMVKDGENGFLFQVEDTENAKEKIERLINDPELRNEMGRRGRELVEKQYTLQLLGERVEDIYRVALRVHSISSQY